MREALNAMTRRIKHAVRCLPAEGNDPVRRAGAMAFGSVQENSAPAACLSSSSRLVVVISAR